MYNNCIHIKITAGKYGECVYFAHHINILFEKKGPNEFIIKDTSELRRISWFIYLKKLGQ